VADFGFAEEAAVLDGGCAECEQHTNALWVAPEVLTSKKHSESRHYIVTKASDMYSFAAVMSEVLTGLPPLVAPDAEGWVDPRQVSLWPDHQVTVLLQPGASSTAQSGWSKGCDILSRRQSLSLSLIQRQFTGTLS
jgi:serine/threonine protein kinase